MFKDTRSKIEYAIFEAIANLHSIRDISQKPSDVDRAINELRVLMEKEQMRGKNEITGDNQ